MLAYHYCDLVLPLRNNKPSGIHTNWTSRFRPAAERATTRARVKTLATNWISMHPPTLTESSIVSFASHDDRLAGNRGLQLTLQTLDPRRYERDRKSSTETKILDSETECEREKWRTTLSSRTLGPTRRMLNKVSTDLWNSRSRSRRSEASETEIINESQSGIKIIRRAMPMSMSLCEKSGRARLVFGCSSLQSSP